MKKISILLALTFVFLTSCQKEKKNTDIQSDENFIENAMLDKQIRSHPFTDDPKKLYAFEMPLILKKVEALQRLGKTHPELYRMGKEQLLEVFGYIDPARTKNRLEAPITCMEQYINNMDMCDYILYAHTTLAVFGGFAIGLVSGPGGVGAFTGGMMIATMTHSLCRAEAANIKKNCDAPPPVNPI